MRGNSADEVAERILSQPSLTGLQVRILKYTSLSVMELLLVCVLSALEGYSLQIWSDVFTWFTSLPLEENNNNNNFETWSIFHTDWSTLHCSIPLKHSQVSWLKFYFFPTENFALSQVTFQVNFPLKFIRYSSSYVCHKNEIYIMGTSNVITLSVELLLQLAFFILPLYVISSSRLIIIVFFH